MTTLKKVLNLLNEIDITLINIVDDFWTPRLKRNAKELLFYQYEQLERTKCIDNFRILAENKNTLRKGFFFSDSDAYKWAEAAALSLTKIKDQNLKKILDAFIELIEKTQEDDGYIYTYNQINFPNRRWSNLLMEHELYCMGHLIEAGIAHFYATNSTKFLNIAKMTADLIVREFTGKPSEWTPGHEEIELALI
ncbi:MAG: beta-L-arabinofuranosidase domain-containing protein, partial [Promethearchaeota archaeon]